MKAMFSLLLFFVFSNSTYADTNFKCKAWNLSSRVQLTLNKSLNFKNGRLHVDPKDCAPTHHDRYMEICSLGKNTLLVSTTSGQPSVLVLENTNVYKMTCDHPETRQQDQQPQQQQQEQEDERDEPGHGGSTIGGRG